MIGRWIAAAIVDDNGEPDVGNLGLFVLIGAVIGAIPFVCGMVLLRAVLAAFWDITMPFDVQAFGIAIGAICSGFATAIGGWGAARRLADNKGAVSDQTSTTTVQTDGSVQQTSQRVDAK